MKMTLLNIIPRRKEKNLFLFSAIQSRSILTQQEKEFKEYLHHRFLISSSTYSIFPMVRSYLAYQEE